MQDHVAVHSTVDARSPSCVEDVPAKPRFDAARACAALAERIVASGKDAYVDVETIIDRALAEVCPTRCVSRQRCDALVRAHAEPLKDVLVAMIRDVTAQAIHVRASLTDHGVVIAFADSRADRAPDVWPVSLVRRADTGVVVRAEAHAGVGRFAWIEIHE